MTATRAGNLKLGCTLPAEDIRRGVEDTKINNTTTTRLTRHNVRPDGCTYDEQVKTVRWSEVRVGDIIRVDDNEAVPADMMLLHCALPEGVCFLQTTSLDGETNLKVRRPAQLRSAPELAPAAPACPADVLNLTGTLSCDQPNAQLHVFNGKLELWRPSLRAPGRLAAAAAGGFGSFVVEDPSTPRTPINNSSDYTDDDGGGGGGPVGAIIGVSMDEMLLRGCTLRNSGYAVGVVVYTGRETRIMQNMSRAPRVKKGMFDRFLNVQVIVMVMLQLVLCLGFAIAAGGCTS